MNSIFNPETHQFSTLNWNFSKKDHQFSVLNWLVKKGQPIQWTEFQMSSFNKPIQCTELVLQKGHFGIQCTELVCFSWIFFPSTSHDFLFFWAKLLIRIRPQEHYSCIAPCMGQRLHVFEDIPPLHMGAVVHQLLPLLLLSGPTHGWLGSSSYSSSGALRLSLQS